MTFKSILVHKLMFAYDYRNTIQINHGSDWWGDAQKVGDKVEYHKENDQFIQTGVIVSTTGNAAFIKRNDASLADKIAFSDITYNYRLGIKKSERITQLTKSSEFHTMSILDTVNARRAVQKQAQEVILGNSLEAMCNAITNDLSLSVDRENVSKFFSEAAREAARLAREREARANPRIATPQGQNDSNPNLEQQSRVANALSANSSNKPLTAYDHAAYAVRHQNLANAFTANSNTALAQDHRSKAISHREKAMAMQATARKTEFKSFEDVLAMNTVLKAYDEAVKEYQRAVKAAK